MLQVVDDDLAEAHEHDKQSDAAQAKFVRQGPEEDEEPYADADAVDALRQAVADGFLFYLAEELIGQGSPCGNGLFGHAIGCLAALVSEEEHQKDDEHRAKEDAKDAEQGDFSLMHTPTIIVLEVGSCDGLRTIGQGGDTQCIHTSLPVDDRVVEFVDAHRVVLTIFDDGGAYHGLAWEQEPQSEQKGYDVSFHIVGNFYCFLCVRRNR